MIEDIKQFSGKSFQNYSGPVEKFKEKNIIFGHNGRGKTSLAYGIIEEFKKDINEYNFRFFNRDYIKKSLLLEDDNSKLKGVKAVFGESAVSNENRIKELTESLQDEEEPIKENDRLRKETRKIIDTIHNNKKGSININKKAAKLTIEDVINQYKNDIIEAKKIVLNEEEIKKYQGDDIPEKELERYEKFNLPNLKIEPINEEAISRIITIFGKTFKDIEVPGAEIIKWLNEGLGHHKEDDNCKFCGNNINLIKIKEKVEAYNDNERQKAVLRLRDFRDILNKTIRVLESVEEQREVILEYLNETEVSQVFILLDEYKKSIEANLVDVSKKIENINECLISELQSLNEVIININNQSEKLLHFRQNKIKAQRIKVDNQGILVKGAIGLAISEDLSIKKNLARIKETEVNIQLIKKGNAEKKSEIRKLNELTSEYGDFLNFLNEVLTSIEINLKLVGDSDGKNYVLQHSKTNEPLTIEDISEGEMNLLSLMFFYFELYEDDQQQIFKDQIRLVVIDDPISSLDEANKFYVMELMKKVFSEKDTQIFILTHVWNDYCTLSYGINMQNPDNKIKYGFFEVYKNSNLISKLREIQSNSGPYKKLFQEIFELSQKNKDNFLTNCDLYHTPNSMRRVFEEFLQFKSAGNIIPTKKQQSKIEAIIVQSMNEKPIGQNKKTKLSQLLSVINVLSHQVQHNPESIWQSAKFMMKLIEDMDKAHYNAMKI